MNHADEGLEAAAEEVRAHLVTLRGGAPFLSPADARLLLTWLDKEQRPVPHICAALELAAAQRAKNRSRVPLRLSHAKRYLPAIVAMQTPLSLASAPDPGPHPLQDWLTELGSCKAAWANDLIAAVTGLPTVPVDGFVRGILKAQRAALEAYWAELAPGTQEDRWADALAEVTRMLPQLDTSTRDKLAEERLREQLRCETPLLTAASLMERLAL